MPKFPKNPSPFMKKSPAKDFWPWSKTEKGEQNSLTQYIKLK